MDLYLADAGIAALEAALESPAPGIERAEIQVTTAWHLRQRDGTRALALSSEASVLIADRPGLQVRNALTRCEIFALHGRIDESEAQLAEARRLLLAPGVNPLTEGDALLAEAVVAKARGQRGRELDAYARNVALLAGRNDARRLRIAQAWAAYENTFGGPETGDASEFSSSVSLSDRGNADLTCDALLGAAQALKLSRRDPARAARLFLQASEQARQMGLVRHAIVCTLNAGSALQSLGFLDQAAACCASATELSRQAGWPVLVGASGTQLAALLLELGRLEESHAVLSAAVETLAATPAGINKANACSALGQTLLLMGRSVESLGPMTEAIRMYRDARSSDNLAQNLIGHARSLSAADQPQQALAALSEVQVLIERHGFSALAVAVCEALAEIHQRHPSLPAPARMSLPNAALHYAEATLREGLGVDGWKPSATLLIQLADGWAAAGDMAQAYGYARRAFAAKDEEAAVMSSRLPTLVLRLREGRDDDDARPLSSMPAKQLAPKLLSPKEHEVLRLLARNLSNKEIATALEIGEETVKWHLKKVFNKLEAGSRKHAVVRARTLGVISFSS